MQAINSSRRSVQLTQIIMANARSHRMTCEVVRYVRVIRDDLRPEGRFVLSLKTIDVSVNRCRGYACGITKFYRPRCLLRVFIKRGVVGGLRANGSSIEIVLNVAHCDSGALGGN